MRLALLEGRKALPNCLPNPPVGCVLVKDGKVIASGHTQSPGNPHAEAMALSQVKGPLHEIIAYVTLEPCSFVGRTPSCAQALIERRVGKVVVSLIDPDARNAGKGIEMLRRAGVTIQVGVLAHEAMEDLGKYLALPANISLQRTLDPSARPLPQPVRRIKRR